MSVVLLWRLFELCFCVICVFCLSVVLVRLSVPAQVIDWKDSSPKRTYDVLMRTFNLLTHSPTHPLTHSLSHSLTQKSSCSCNCNCSWIQNPLIVILLNYFTKLHYYYPCLMYKALQSAIQNMAGFKPIGPIMLWIGLSTVTSASRRGNISAPPADDKLLVVPRYRLSTYGRRAFAVAGPSVWNFLPDNLRDPAV